MEFSFDFEMSKENKKAIEELLKQKGIKHYVLETKDKEKLDLVEYEYYKKLEEEKQEIIEFLKKEQDILEKNKLDYSVDYYVCRKIFLKEILSKIEKSDK